MRTRSFGEHARPRGWARVAAAAALAVGGHWLAGCLGNPLPQDPADAGPVEPVPPDAAAPPDAMIDPGAPDPRGPTLASLFVSGVDTAIAAVPGTTGYEVDLGFWAEEVTVTATSTSTTDTLTVAGAAVQNGAPSQPLAMSVGENGVDIVVENILGEQRTFRLTLRRAAEIAQYAYCKTSTGTPEGHFGRAIAISGDRLAILSRGEDAVYMLGRSGTSWEVEEQLTPDRFDTLGWLSNLAFSGDTLAIKVASGDYSGELSSSVYVLRHDGAAWQHEAHLTASNADLDHGFGHSLALAGDLLVVGAPRDDSAATGVDGDQDDDTADDSGAAYVFRRTGSTWRQEAYLKASNTEERDSFGYSVAVAGDTIAVAAPNEDSAATGVDGEQHDEGAYASGAVYVFRYSSAGWQQEAYVKSSNTYEFHSFGDAVALSGDTLAVGANDESSSSSGIDGDQTPGGLDSGAVYVFRRSDAGWQQEAFIKASNPESMAGFGFKVALAGNALAVGAPWETGAGTGVNPEPMSSGSQNGAAYLFHRTGTTWQQDAYVKASNTGYGDLFGYSVAVSSNTLVVGALQESSAGTGINGDQTNTGSPNSGAVYIFH